MCPTFCDPMGCSMSGFPVPHHLQEFAQVRVQCISDIIQPSYPLLPSSPSAFNLSQHQGFFPVSQLAICIRWPKYWSFSFNISPSNEYSGLNSFRMDWLDLLAVQGISRVFSNTTVQKHQFFSTLPSLLSSSHIRT